MSITISIRVLLLVLLIL